MTRIKMTITPKIISCNNGWLPVIVVNGNQKGNTYQERVYSKDEAIALAYRAADDEAARYGGDWDITITKLEPTQ
jgi:hypothetical protein